MLTQCSPPMTCHVSCVTCHISHVIFLLQIGAASRWRVCYQQGLPRLVFLVLDTCPCELLEYLLPLSGRSAPIKYHQQHQCNIFMAGVNFLL